MQKSTVNVFDFVNYRTFLRSLYEDMHFTDSSVSYKTIQEAAGYSRTSNHFWQVLEGHITLSEQAAERYAKAFGMNGRETKYFCLMAAFERTDDDTERDKIIREMTSSKLFARHQEPTLNAYRLFSDWYLHTLWDMVKLADFVEDYELIAERFFFPITSAVVRRGFRALLEMGFLERDENGRLRQVHTSFSDYAAAGLVHDPIVLTARRNFLRESISQAPQAMTQPYEKRIFNLTTMVLSEEEFEIIKENILKFLTTINDGSRDDTEKKYLYQLNLQFFSRLKL